MACPSLLASDFAKFGLLMALHCFLRVFCRGYYNTIANDVTEKLIAAHQIIPPETYYTYAVKAPNNR